MSGFMFLAVLMTLAAAAAVGWPLLRRSSDAPQAWPATAVTAVILVAGAALLYPTWSSWNWSAPAPAADSPAAMVGSLARRLERQPDDLAGWMMLGRSYSVIEQFALSARAYERASKLAGGKNAEALMGLAEALVNAGRSDLDGEAGRLFEQALEIEPNSVKALFYSAIAAAERNELPLSRSRFVRLLDGNPPADVRPIIEDQIRAIDAMATMAVADSAAAAMAAAPAPGETTVAPAQSAAAVVAVPLRITLAAGVAGNADAGAPLFVLARIPGQRGPPLAAKRVEAKFPLEVELLSSDAMMAGTGFAAGQEIEVEARVANGGTAISRSGDPFGVVRVKAGGTARAAIEINQLKP